MTEGPGKGGPRQAGSVESRISGRAALSASRSSCTTLPGCEFFVVVASSRRVSRRFSVKRGG